MEKSLPELFGSILSACRKKKKMSQDQLALETGLQRTFISRMEGGKTQPTLTTIFALATALRMEPVEMIGMVQKEWSGL